MRDTNKTKDVEACTRGGGASLCARCEHRAIYLETGYSERHECSQDVQLKTCRSYAPVIPPILRRHTALCRAIAVRQVVLLSDQDELDPVRIVEGISNYEPYMVLPKLLASLTPLPEDVKCVPYVQHERIPSAALLLVLGTALAIIGITAVSLGAWLGIFHTTSRASAVALAMLVVGTSLGILGVTIKRKYEEMLLLRGSGGDIANSGQRWWRI